MGEVSPFSCAVFSAAYDLNHVRWEDISTNVEVAALFMKKEIRSGRGQCKRLLAYCPGGVGESSFSGTSPGPGITRVSGLMLYQANHMEYAP